jgi:hypothetical protein
MSGFISKIKSLFSSSGAGEPAPGKETSQTIGDCLVVATPRKEGAQYRLAGRIEKDVGGEKLIRNFVRADLFSSESDVLEITFRKATQIIEQNGPSLWAGGEKERQV